MITKGHLAAFADDRNVVDVLDVLEGRGYPSSIENATVVSYVYDPSVFTHDLEKQFAEIEDKGVGALNRLRAGVIPTGPDKLAVIEFLDMHLHRGRYADRAGDSQPATLFMKDGSVEETHLNYGDLISLAHDHPDTLRLTSFGLEGWQWQIYTTTNLWTGDGAVMLFRPNPDHPLSTVTFPLSPTQLLVIGDDVPTDFDMSRAIARRSRRWVVGPRGNLPIEAIRRMKAEVDATR
ncbi:DUF4238 domain-containing protein [Microbacterium sp. BF1]|jgi:hypothetical protein|uniref:DUF4238 domain-containing protein n=1 Tax=Microbacterium sp. BF1 TaxID=2821146 RepID=UPI001C4E1E3E|nr:DUF4238 domain-containing protein [Microbacterium sp. BF1]